MARQRIEDLGILSEMLDSMYDSDIFEWMPYGLRTKDATLWFSSLGEDEKMDKIHELAYMIQKLREDLWIAYMIARYGIDESDKVS